MCASLKRRRCVSGVGFTPRMIKDKCAAITNDDRCGYTDARGMTSRPMTVDEMLALGWM